MLSALLRAFPAFFPRRIRLWILLGMVPNFIRCAFVPTHHPFDAALRLTTHTAYLAGCFIALASVARARKAGDPMGRRFLGGLLITIAPVLVELASLLFFDVQLHLTGLAMMFMAISIGISWLWVITQNLHQRLHCLERDIVAWRNLLPGSTWHTEEKSELMEDLFGADWPTHLQDRMMDRTGTPYLLHSMPLEPEGALGWIETNSETLPGAGAFMAGWCVAVGMDEGEDCDQLLQWLESWGAQVQHWGTVPPREGPYPSLLIWAREPSILSVWREDGPGRRKSRWIQIGGADIEGPHVRLDRPVEPGALRQALQRLLSFRSE
jgi:hypothetical protein